MSLHVDTFRLVTWHKQESMSFGEHMAAPYLVFTYNLWLALLGVTVVTGIAMYFVDQTNSYSDAPLPGPLGSLYLSFFSMATGGPSHAPVSPAAKVINIGFAFFILLVISAYTANLASILVRNQREYGIQNLEQALVYGQKVCVEEVLTESFFHLYPSLRDRAVMRDNATHILAGMDEGVCDAAILSEVEFNNERRLRLPDDEDDDSDSDDGRRRRARALLAKGKASGGKASASSSGALSGDGDQYDGLSVANCDKQQMGSTLTTYANSMPVRRDLQDVFSAILEQGRVAGLFQKEMKAARAEFQHLHGCPPISYTSDSDRMTVTAFSGPIISYGFTIVLGIFLHMVATTPWCQRQVWSLIPKRLQPYIRREESESPGENPSGLSTPSPQRNGTKPSAQPYDTDISDQEPELEGAHTKPTAEPRRAVVGNARARIFDTALEDPQPTNHHNNPVFQAHPSPTHVLEGLLTRQSSGQSFSSLTQTEFHSVVQPSASI